MVASTDVSSSNVLFWPAAAGTPHPLHFLRAVESPSAQEASPAYFVTLDVQAEQAARDKFAQALGARLRAFRGDRSRNEVAQYLGRHPNTIAKFERGDNVPDAWELVRLARLFTCTVQDFFELGSEVLPRSMDDSNQEFVMVREYSVLDSEEVVGRFAFKKSWLDARGVRPTDLAVVSANGDSMEPTVRDSDILLVDTSVKGVRSDGIYLIEQGGELRCKRLQVLIGGGVKIRSDNQKYETEEISAEQATQLRVVAKVMWIGGER